MKKTSALIALGLILGLAGSANAEDAYKRAVLNYQAHHYSAALSDFEKLVAAYPNNAMVRYYRGLSYQGTNQISLAKKDFEWVATNCPDGRVKQLGAAGLRNLGNYRSSTSGSSSGSTVAYSSTPSAPAAVSAASSNPGGKLSKVLEFTSATCPTCITFAPIFEQTRSRFPNVDMQQLDVADSGNASLVSQYSVRNYPTIVFLSGSGQVLFQRAGAPTSVDQFAQLIAKYR
ncbi:MAG TPA: thioredoxin domain-containing protein [Drouetiella sp.]